MDDSGELLKLRRKFASRAGGLALAGVGQVALTAPSSMAASSTEDDRAADVLQRQDSIRLLRWVWSHRREHILCTYGRTLRAPRNHLPSRRPYLMDLAVSRLGGRSVRQSVWRRYADRYNRKLLRQLHVASARR